MDMTSMVMGALIASMMWSAFVPWTRLRRLKETEDRLASAQREALPSDTTRDDE